MVYLVAKYCLIFLITALLGFLVGRWSIRRLFVDVTDSFDTLSATSRAAGDAPWDEIRARFDDINPNVRNIVQNEFLAHPYPEIPRALFDKLTRHINEVKEAVVSLPKPEQIDLTGIVNELRSVRATVAELSTNVTDNVAKHDDIDALGKALESQLHSLEGDIAAIPDAMPPSIVNFSPLEEKIAALQASFDELTIPEQVDLSSIESRLTALTGSVQGLLDKPQLDHLALADFDQQLTILRNDVSTLVNNTETPNDEARAILMQISTLDNRVAESITAISNRIDLAPVNKQIAQMAGAIERNTEATKTIQTELDAAKLEEHLQTISVGVAHVRENQMEVAHSAANIDQRLNKFDEELEQLLNQTAQSAELLKPLQTSVDEITDNLGDWQNTEAGRPSRLLDEYSQRLESMLNAADLPQRSELTPLDQKLDKIHARLDALNEDQNLVIPENGQRPSIGPKLLKRAQFGRKDRLQEIAGIGPKLEQTLNKLGVYYYWQIAAWDKRDIRTVDANLEAFRGRIERDDWVRQAKTLRKLAHAAPAPSGRELSQKLN